MKRHLIKYLPIFLIFTILMCINSTHVSVGRINEPIRSIAVILDASESYDTNFMQDVLNGFDLINKTFNIDYDVFQLSDYTVTNSTYYQASYNYYNSTSNQTIATNHTLLAETLIKTGKYDLIAFIGYELRRIGHNGRPLSELYNDTKFIYYDLSGEISSDGHDSKQENVLRVSFSENEAGYMAGRLAAATISSFPQKIAAIGIKPFYWLTGEPRSNKLIAGFQAGIFKQITDTDIDITFIENFTDYSVAKSLGTKLESDGYKLVFAALQNENTLGILDGFSHDVITLDSDRSQISSHKPFGCIVKNNTKTLFATFKFLNQSTNFPWGDLTYGFSDGVFYPTGWDDSPKINTTLEQIHTDIVVNKITIPQEIIMAKNTPSFSIVSGLILLCVLSLIIRKVK